MDDLEKCLDCGVVAAEEEVAFQTFKKDEKIEFNIRVCKECNFTWAEDQDVLSYIVSKIEAPTS